MIKVMIIDDQPQLIRGFLEDILDERYQVSQTDNVDDIYLDLMTVMPDIILMDICLDGFERWDILQRIKMEYPLIPVLIVGTYDSFALDSRLDLADGYTAKNIYPNKIGDKMKELLNPNKY